MSNKKAKIVIVTAGQPSLNPRLVKEADTFAHLGHQVTVIYAYWNAWGTQLDAELLQHKAWKAIRAGGDPDQRPYRYLISRIWFKAATIFTRITGSTMFATSAISRAGRYLTREAKKHPADLYIGHNLGALPAVVAAAKKYGKPCGFDVEDLHRYEVTDDDNSIDVKLKRDIEDKYIPLVQYLTVSSPLIADRYKQWYPKIDQQIILNAFPANGQVAVPAATDARPVRSFWFSQTVGTNRGIDVIIKALQILKDTAFELHLLGQASAGIREAFAAEIAQTKSSLYFHDPIGPDGLAVFASQFDIGFAAEPGFCLNNNFALSNKIFTYVQAGLAVLASNTPAQQTVLSEYPDMGYIYDRHDATSLAQLLTSFENDRSALLNTRKRALEIGRQQLSWENEQKKLMGIINQYLPGE